MRDARRRRPAGKRCESFGDLPRSEAFVRSLQEKRAITSGITRSAAGACGKRAPRQPHGSASPPHGCERGSAVRLHRAEGRVCRTGQVPVERFWAILTNRLSQFPPGLLTSASVGCVRGCMMVYTAGTARHSPAALVPCRAPHFCDIRTTPAQHPIAGTAESAPLQ